MNAQFKQVIEAANWKMVHSWYTDIGLYYAGVNLGDVLTYDMLNVLGRIWKLQTGATETIPDIPAGINGGADGAAHTAS